MGTRKPAEQVMDAVDTGVAAGMGCVAVADTVRHLERKTVKANRYIETFKAQGVDAALRLIDVNVRRIGKPHKKYPFVSLVEIRNSETHPDGSHLVSLVYENNSIHNGE